jgi:hypothetical protein
MGPDKARPSAQNVAEPIRNATMNCSSGTPVAIAAWWRSLGYLGMPAGRKRLSPNEGSYLRSGSA